MKIYGVINMDVVGSRKIKDRDRFQKRLDEYISLANNEFSKILPAPISITLGDEWQLITNEPQECYNIIHRFQQLLWPEGVELYAGIGIGDLGTSINEDIRKMDGISFHMAREALDIAKNNAGAGRKSNYLGSKHNRVYLKLDKNAINSSSYKEYLRADEKQSYMETAAAYESYDLPVTELSDALGIEDIVNTIIDNNEIHKSRMSMKQKLTYINYMKYGSYREMIHMQSGISFGSIAAISQKLNTAEYFTVQHNHEMVKRILKYICLPGSVTH